MKWGKSLEPKNMKRLLVVAGSLLAVLGLILSLVPIYVPQPGGEPRMINTYWVIGLPLVFVGAGLVAWGWRTEPSPPEGPQGPA